MQAETRVVQDAEALSRAGVDEFSRCAREAIAAHGRFAVALSGGSTPKAIYSLLAGRQNDPAAALPWSKIYIFFGDERHVPPTDPQSNYRMANEALLSKVSIPPGNVHRIAAELDAEAAAADYDTQLHSFFQTPSGEWPRFDLIMLGLGPEGHTASLFPGSAALNENSRWVVANWVEKVNAYRITFTFPLINHAAETLFLAAGEEKAEVLKGVLQPKPADDYPAERIKPVNGRLLWIVDKSAAKLL
jgi:6-phosphogluconolactonase